MILGKLAEKRFQSITQPVHGIFLWWLICREEVDLGCPDFQGDCTAPWSAQLTPNQKLINETLNLFLQLEGIWV
jgi:hypothetical protein